MSLFDTPHKRKSALLTSTIALLLLLLFSWLGLSYLDPPISYGMEVSFGTSSQGKGRAPAEVPQRQVEQKEDIPEPEEQKATPPPETIEDKSPETLTEEEAPISVDKEEKKTTKSEIKEQEPPVEEQVEKIPKPTLSKSTKQVLSNILNAPKKTANESQESKGDDEVAEDKGKPEGNPYANSYYTSSGLGGNTSYGLNGRNLQSNGSVTQKCNQEGRVVVRITVDQNGTVILAEAGVKGTTNSHPCLLTPAKETAFLHRWTPDANAPKTQVGFVVINFKLGE